MTFKEKGGEKNDFMDPKLGITLSKYREKKIYISWNQNICINQTIVEHLQFGTKYSNSVLKFEFLLRNFERIPSKNVAF